ncbi:MAG: transglutaminase domain-containing protein, partial [Syntrophomonas sp.]
MDININPITIGLVALLAFPLIQGAVEPLSLGGIRQRLWSLLDTVGFLMALYMAIVLTRRIFFDHDSGVFLSIYNWIPENIRVYLYGQDVLIYVIVVPIFLLILIELIRLLTPAIYRRWLLPLADQLYNALSNSGRFLSSSAGALAQIPRAAFMVFIGGLLLNFFAYYYPSPNLSKWMNESTAYQGLYQQALYPA